MKLNVSEARKALQHMSKAQHKMLLLAILEYVESGKVPEYIPGDVNSAWLSSWFPRIIQEDPDE